LEYSVIASAAKQSRWSILLIAGEARLLRFARNDSTIGLEGTMLSILQERRSIRKYKPEHIEEHIIDTLKEAVVCGDERKSDVWVEDCSIAST